MKYKPVAHLIWWLAYSSPEPVAFTIFIAINEDNKGGEIVRSLGEGNEFNVSPIIVAQSECLPST